MIRKSRKKTGIMNLLIFSMPADTPRMRMTAVAVHGDEVPGTEPKETASVPK
jgi:hypothetical protein